jgi:hypothetical protein
MTGRVVTDTLTKILIGNCYQNPGSVKLLGRREFVDVVLRLDESKD